ncbi:TetR/AcrR family transcriptional regulator [Paraburkholderia sp. JPY419]|uniref:TetR/AcrR family transcriptional regulator n=1 Tax=Paraburkholderia sp. JPY419 TaxID=667660 RepID=UPI003D1DDA9D
MSKRTPGSGSLSRAKTPEDKAKVRQAFVDAGRLLLAREDASQVSLRRIASEAGYSPASIYQYFDDQRALFVAVREDDLTAAAEYFEEVASCDVDALFDALPEPPLPNRLAGDTLIAAIYGVVLVPRTTPTKRWSDTCMMVELTVDAIIDNWVSGRGRDGHTTRGLSLKRKPR